MHEENGAGVSVRQHILELAGQWASALVANDADAIGSFMDEDWVIVGNNGTSGKRDFLRLVESGDLTHEKMELVSEARIKVYADTAVLTGRVINRGHYKGEPFGADEWTTDVFLRRDGRWLCVLSHVTPARTTVQS